MLKCLSVAGSDCSGGAGIQADLKAFSANETFGMSVITSVVAENTTRVLSVFNVPVEEIQKQIDAVFEDIHVDAVKLGMLPTAEIISAVADKLNEYKPSIIVCDPVMVATSGDALSEGGTVSTMREKLFPIVTLLTPNIPEAEAISGLEIKNENHMEKAARIIMDMGVKTSSSKAVISLATLWIISVPRRAFISLPASVLIRLIPMALAVLCHLP